jgi:hypothetical protein
MAGAPEHEQISAESIPATPEGIADEFRADMVAA